MLWRTIKPRSRRAHISGFGATPVVGKGFSEKVTSEQRPIGSRGMEKEQTFFSSTPEKTQTPPGEVNLGLIGFPGRRKWR